MRKEIPKTYEASKYEAGIYKLWEESGFFRPEAGQPLADSLDKIKSEKKYCNVLPPPNANGELHLGHASGYTVMDVFGRYRRMKGEKVLLLPGKDHAGILTQVVYERKIKEERNITRHDLGREKFYSEAYDFCIGQSAYMRAQEKRIGISADWSREKFTLDPDVLKVALETFVKMHADGLIYRGERIINWCPRCATALSDLEVAYKKTKDKLYWIKYGPFVLATSRPETKLGDTAVAVNPADKRYKNMVGRKYKIPGVLGEFKIVVVADKAADPEFGSGAIKVTPAHDFTDYEIAQRHNLPMRQIINEKGQMMENTGKYAGMTTQEARKAIVEDMKKMGLIDHIDENYEHNLAVCERCGSVIEPIPSKQWFVNVDAKKYSIKKECLKAIRTGKIKVYPESSEKILVQWFENLRDWCISRQIWWGPRIPVWYKSRNAKRETRNAKHSIIPSANPEQAVDLDNKMSMENTEQVYAGVNPPEGEGWKQEEDTFDTWFSSGQWAYSTLGYPNGKDFKEFYPTDMMVMGRDILFFWSARMIMMSLYRTGKIPFKNLYFTGLIRDKEGRKMSKSRGNGINPLEMIDKYGADALRLSLFSGTTPGQDSRLYEEKIESFRNFVTKLWNIYRYSANSSEQFELIGEISEKETRTLSDRWIINELNKTILTVGGFMENKEISLAQEALRKFTWGDLADWYLEIHKIEKNDKVLGYVLDKILKLWHPFMPFVTEKIYSDANIRTHANDTNKLLMIAKWPEANGKMIDKKAEKEFRDLQNTIVKIRNLRASYRINPAQIIDAYSERKIENKEIIEKLARIKIISKKPGTKMIKISSLNMDIAALIDVKKEIERMEKEIKNLESAILKTENLLKNKKFTGSAPKEIIEANKVRILEYKEKLKSRQNLLVDLKRL